MYRKVYKWKYRVFLYGYLWGSHTLMKLQRLHHWTLFDRLDVYPQNKVKLGSLGSSDGQDSIEVLQNLDM